MRRPALVAVLVGLALLAGAGLRAAATADKYGLTHDESISLLAATCHQGEYARLTLGGRPPAGAWVAAREWKRLMRPDRALCLGTIGRDLAFEDIHPPLYFWLLHLWTLVAGSHLWTGPALNIALSLAAGAALFGLARRALGDARWAGLVAATWAFSPAVIVVALEARQYELLGLAAILFAWQLLRFCDPPTRRPLRDGALLAAATAAGALTAYVFAFVAAGGAVLLVWRLRRRARLLAAGLGAMAAGYALFALAHPHFLRSFERQQAQRLPPEPGGLERRADLAATSIAGYLLPPGPAAGPARFGALALLALFAVWVAAVLVRRRPAAGTIFPAAMFAALLAVTAGLYLLFVTPGSAMEVRHLSFLWPFCAFVPVMAVAALRRPRVRAAAAGALAAGLAAAGTATAAGYHRPVARPAVAPAASGVVVVSVARGILLPVVWQIPDAMPVLAASQRELLRRSEAWLPRLDAGGVLITGLPLGDPRYGDSPERRRRVLRAARRRLRLTPAARGPLDYGRVLVVAGRRRAGG